MPGHWVRAPRLLECSTADCQRSMVRNELVYLMAGSEKWPVCPPCAERRIGQHPPSSLPLLDAPVPDRMPIAHTAQQLRLVSDAIELPKPGAIDRFNRADVDGTLRKVIRKVQQQTRRDNDIDPKLKQLGGDR